MIQSFSCKDTEKVFLGQPVKKWDVNLRKKAMKRLFYLHSAKTLDDLKVPPSNRLHKLTGDLAEYHSISINMQWRVIFVWKEGDALEVKITDYH